LNAGRFPIMASAGRVQDALRLIDILLPSFALFSLSRLLLCAFALSARLRFLECERGLAILRLVGALLRMLLRLAALSLARGLLRSAVAIARSKKPSEVS
jgi:hypothetical protein